jgi:hypothetical protein
MVSLIRAMPEANWTAVKITQYGHDVCSTSGESCDCAPGDSHPYALSEETQPGGADTGRYLAAGAVRAFWLRTAEGKLGEAIEPLRRILSSSENAIFESNSVIQFMRPQLYIAVLDFSVGDVKKSLRRWIDRADALAIAGRGAQSGIWADVPASLIESKPQFVVQPPDYSNSRLVELVRANLQAAGNVTTTETV